LDVSFFNSLKVGDRLETPSPFPALTDEPVKLLCTAQVGVTADFVVTYLGATLGKWSAANYKGSIKWKL
jgi:hypothetical protein